MSELSPADVKKLDELEKLCRECKDAINEQSDEKLKSAMEEACDKCRSVRDLVPELMEFRQKSENS